jgi:hypothetical protein
MWQYKACIGDFKHLHHRLKIMTIRTQAMKPNHTRVYRQGGFYDKAIKACMAVHINNPKREKLSIAASALDDIKIQALRLYFITTIKICNIGFVSADIMIVGFV